METLLTFCMSAVSRVFTRTQSTVIWEIASATWSRPMRAIIQPNNILFIYCSTFNTHFFASICRKAVQPGIRMSTALFRMYLDRGDLPIGPPYGKRMSKQTILTWRVFPGDLNYFHYLPIFFDGYVWKGHIPFMIGMVECSRTPTCVGDQKPLFFIIL